MTYREYTQGRIKMEALHAEASKAHLEGRIRRQRISDFLRRLAARVEAG